MAMPAEYDDAPQRGEASPAETLLALVRSGNVAEEIGEDLRASISDRVCREYEIDKQSRSEWEERSESAMKLAMQVVEKKNYPWENASNVKYPLITVAALQFSARAFPAIVPSREVVKGRVVGNDAGVPEIDPETAQPIMQVQRDPETGEPVEVPVWRLEPGEKRKKGDRIGRHMSWQLTDQMECWQDETDMMTVILPIVGCAFRKSYFDPVKGHNIAELVMAEDLVVNYAATDIDTAPRVTHVIPLYPYQIEERMRDGRFRRAELSTALSEDEDAPQNFLEQHRRLDLDGDGYPEPWIVTVHEDSKEVVRLEPGFDETGIVQDEDGEIVAVTPEKYFTRYVFMFSPDGGFYGMGFGTLIGPLNESVNSTINQMLDAGHLQNAGGGLIDGGLGISGRVKLKPGEYKVLNTLGGKSIRESVWRLDHPGPSAVLFQLLGALIDAAQDIAAVKDVMLGDQQGTQTATTTLALIEQGLKVFTSIYKRIHRALKRELGILRRLNALYLNPQEYFAVEDQLESVTLADYQDDGTDVVPISDPTLVTDMQKMGRAQYLAQFLGDPFVNQMELRQRMLDAGSIDSIDRLLQPPPPDPELVAQDREYELSVQTFQMKLLETEARVERMEAETELLFQQAGTENAKTALEMRKQNFDLLKQSLAAMRPEQQKSEAEQE